MPISSALVTRFFQLLVNKQFAEAERELERLKQRMHNTEWNQGYFRALHGMLISRRSNSTDYSFLSKLDFNDKEALQHYRREFLGHVRNRLHGDFDRGFFSAWADCMRVLGRMVVNNPEGKGALPGREKPKNLVKNRSQVTIENFLREKA